MKLKNKAALEKEMIRKEKKSGNRRRINDDFL